MKLNNREENMSYVIIVLQAVLIFSIAVDNVRAIDSAAYKNSEFSFGFNYPGNWKREEPRLPGTVVKITSPDGSLAFNVGAQWDRSLRNVHPKDFVKKFSSRQISKMYQNDLPNFNLLEAGETTLSNQPAYYIVYTHVWKLVGGEIPWKTMTVFSNRSGIQYTLTAGGYPQVFDNNKELILSIFRSFVTVAPLN